MSLWLGQRDGEVAAESEGAGVLVVSLGTRGIGALVVSAGRWGIVVFWETAVKAERTEAADKLDSAPPMLLLCSADHLLPDV